ncbi:possible prophage ps3 protein01-like protein [Moritella sp. PE36]|uniref:Panacea domain-containing protein n=1 Tax=Moritella sp. PE36 TaxID=58051 RepID=UPI0001568476|nr:type II toxin-antitoxin system antitoxin SocA domain-containing protein [Moritella sp. PE36]EDM68295.1 possible prophage ps3 protein01-like protein [Moritella sp. PE36]
MANVTDVAEFIIGLANRDDDDIITNLKLQKITYYAQGFYLALFDKPLFDDEIQAWAHGPVIPDLYHKYKINGKNHIVSDAMFDAEKCLAEQEREHLNDVYDIFGQFSAWKLRNMTHEEAPWIDNEKSANIITKTELKRYFDTRVD